MTPLFLWHNGPRLDVLFARAVYRALLDTGRFELAIGACRDDEAVLADLRSERCRVLTSAFANTQHGSPIDLEHLRPAGMAGFEVWLGGAERHPSYQWADVVEWLRSTLADRGLGGLRADLADVVPMLDFAASPSLPVLRRPSLWLDTSRVPHAIGWFVFDVARLLEALPDHDLLCTAPVGLVDERIVDVSGLGPVQRSKLSEQCEVLVGRTMDPFALTLTEANRWKPKALCGFDARTCAPLWDYPGNPLELLATMDDLVDFLLANVAAVRA